MTSQHKSKLFFLGVLFLFSFTLGLYASSHYTVEDEAIHTEIAMILREQGYPTSYLPVSDIVFTYPPLFHFIALIISFFGVPLHLAVRLLGILAFSTFPLLMYAVCCQFEKRAAIFGAVAAATSANILIVFLFSEFPQILAFDFFVLGLFYWWRQKPTSSGIFFGLVVLTHPFMGLFTIAFCGVLVLVYKTRQSLQAAVIAIIISLAWSKQYFLIFTNIFFGHWNNIRWYGNGPGFISLENLVNFFIIRLGIIPVILSVIGFFFLWRGSNQTREEKWVISILTLIPLFFTFYHYPAFQYKFLDLLTIPLIIVASIAVQKSEGNVSERWFFTGLFLFLCIGVGVQMYIVTDYHSKFFALEPELESAANKLRTFDPVPSKIVVAIHSSARDKETLRFNSELVFSQIANKIPLDGTISDLEAYTQSYRQQLLDREEIILGNQTLLAHYNITYFINNTCPENYALVHPLVCQWIQRSTSHSDNTPQPNSMANPSSPEQP